MGQGDFIDYKKISFVIFSYVFKLNGFFHLFALQKRKLKAKDRAKDFDFINVLLAAKNLNIISKYDKVFKNLRPFL